MDLKIEKQLFIVTGASSGLGNAVAIALLENGATVIAVARREAPMKELSKRFSGRAEILCGDVLEEQSIQMVIAAIDGRELAGVFVNAGGPPAMSFKETSVKEWDEAYKLLLRWKVDLVSRLIPIFEKQQYGRILFSESSTVKQPIENLVLSNSLRMAVAGMAKTLSLEVASKGVTVNLIGPGFHETEAVERLFVKKAEQEKISVEEARKAMLGSIPSGRIGNPEDFASLASWLLSPLSGFVTGQVYTLDGGTTKHSLG